jgi:hypothetical protein
MFPSEVFQSNAYRILRLSASATYSDVHKAADNFKRMATLGLAQSVEADLPQLGEISRTEIDIRSAVSRMGTPAQRLQDRLFWFHLVTKPLDESTFSQILKKYSGDPEAVAALSHDRALHAIIAAISSQLDDDGSTRSRGQI